MSGTRRAQAPGNIRSGFNVRGSRGSVVRDADEEAQRVAQDVSVLPQAVVALVTRGDEILTVSRGDDPNDLNMPGGTVMSGESLRDACVRELWEETGIRAKHLVPVYTRMNNTHVVTTFRVTEYDGKLSGSEEGQPSWEKPEILLRSRYGDYFHDMMSSLYGVKDLI